MAKIFRKHAKKVGVLVVIALLFVSVGYVGQSYIDNLKMSVGKNYEEEIAFLKINKSAKRLAEIKNELVEDLSIECEVKGVPEGQRNGKTIMDTNGYYSRGAWQFQTKTVQYYYGKLYNKEITVDEAVLIAHTEDKARTLAYDIIWKEIGGVFNWQNCTDKLGLAQKIEIIRDLEK